MTFVPPAAVIVLAAGEGTRMRSHTPKVLHPIGGRSMLGHALAAAQHLEPQRIAVVVRHAREQVAAHVKEILPQAVIADQDAIPGTGRAVQCGLSALDVVAQAHHVSNGSSDGEAAADAGLLTGHLVVMAGDVPLLDGPTLKDLVAMHHAEGNAVTILTTEVEDATGYGRIIRDAEGTVAEIVEHRDASDEQRAVREINSSVYVFRIDTLRDALAKTDSHNDQGEVYLTDVVRIAREQGLRAGALCLDDPMLVEGANDQRQLSELRRELNRRTLDKWMIEGVAIIDPATTWIDVDVELAPDVTILPGTQLLGATKVETGATIGPDTTLTDVEVGANATVVRTHALLSVIGPEAQVGPYSYLRPGTELGVKAKVGGFVETKNAQIGNGSKVPHLSYVGDATIGEGTNIGAATIFVNYDGVDKHHANVGSHVRVGADNLIVAPVTIDDGAYTGAGTVVRHDVPAGALAVSSGPQRNIEGWVRRRRPGTPSAEAATGGAPAEPNVNAHLSPQAQHERAQAEQAASAPIPLPPPDMLRPNVREQDKDR